MRFTVTPPTMKGIDTSSGDEVVIVDPATMEVVAVLEIKWLAGSGPGFHSRGL
jgi:hypothetical protein